MCWWSELRSLNVQLKSYGIQIDYVETKKDFKKCFKKYVLFEPLKDSGLPWLVQNASVIFFTLGLFKF